jgi:eukaryotic-like serine/threonine-protein kinase
MNPGDVVDDRFELERIAGVGGMGTVWRARDKKGGAVALKVLKAASGEGADRFAREIRVLAQLRHPGIVRYVADGRVAGRSGADEMYLAMEWLEGESLSARLGRAGLTAGEAVGLARRVAEALGAAHERGIVHRDVKPSNLFLPDGDLERVKVLDFGVARVGDGGTRAATRTGMMLGTPGYMAPEQARGAKDVDARADVFALGCVLFECLTGRAAFVGEHVMALLAKILLEEAPRVSELRPDVPDDLDRLVARSLHKNRDMRPRDGAHFAADLSALGTIVGGERPPAGAPSAALTATEQRLLCVVLVKGYTPDTGEGEGTLARVATLTGDRTVASQSPVPLSAGALDATVSGEEALTAYERLRVAVEGFGARLEKLVDGSLVVTLTGTGGATDQAVQAARCALAMRALVSGPPMALATGRGVLAGRWPVGEAIDRAARLLRAAERADPHPVRLDEVTAGLLDVRFDIGGDRAGLYLRGERDVVEAARTLLGKPTPCVGRDRELGVLGGLLDECIAEPIARAVLVTGAAGVGKSRVRYELLRKLKQRPDPVEVWIGRGDPIRAGSPFGMIAPALRRAAGILDGEPIEVRRQKLRARAARHVSARDLSRVVEFLGEVIGAPFPDADSVELRAARQDAMLLGDQMRRAFETLLAAETSAQPLLIVLEDLHWGDLPTVKLLDSALRNLADRPWMVLALARPEVHELFPSLWAERGVQEVRLGELTKKGSERLIRRVLGEGVSDEIVNRLIERSGGNAFYLEELIRAVAEGKGDAMPETVLAVVQGRLERLEVDARRVLRAASVFGEVFWRGGVTALLGGEERTTGLRTWIDELDERELIARAPRSRFPGDEELTFRHAMVREAAYSMLTESDRRLGHLLAGDWLERAGEGDAMLLAQHFERGGEPARALGWFRRAAEISLAANDFRGALDRAERGANSGASGEVLGALRLIQAEAHRWCGEFAEGKRRGAEAMALLARGSPLWFSAAGEVAEASGKLDDVPPLEAVGEALLAVPGRVAGTMQAVASSLAAFQLFSHGRYQLAEALLDRIEKASVEVRERDPGILARILQARSSRAMFAGDVGAYLESERAAVGAFEQAGDLRYACMQRGHVGYACLEIGAYDDAERWLREALENATRMGLLNVVANAKHNLGRALHRCGRLEEALAMESDALAELTAQGDRRLCGGALLYIGDIHLALGQVDKAEEKILAALEILQDPLRPQALATLTQIRIAQGRPADALAAAREAMALLEQLGGVEEGESQIRMVYAEALWTTGAHDQARAAIRKARERILGRAGLITDPQFRKSFLERIPDNERTLSLARALLADQ